MMPTFINIGAGRAGTTSLYHYLCQHPQVVMSRIKETNFFAYLAMQQEREYVFHPNTLWPAKNLKEYQALFNPAKANFKAVGEASPTYLYAPGVPKQMNAYVRSAKLLLILRNPIDRAYSDYLKNMREGLESRGFEDAIREEIRDPGNLVQSQRYYVRAGMYFHQISRYLEYFDPAQIMIEFYETLASTPSVLLEDIFRFIGVDPSFKPDISVRFNESLPPLVKDISRRRRLKSITRRIRDFLPQKFYFRLLNLQYGINRSVAAYPPLSKETRLFLRDQYVQDIENLGKLLQRDLSSWLDVE